MPNRLWTIVLLAAVTASARAQLRLPSLPVPGVPLQGLPLAIDQTGDRALAGLAAARRLAVTRLIRISNGRVEEDPRGNPIIRGEILAVRPSDAILDHARSIGFSLVREQDLGAAGLRVVVLTAPANLSTRRALDTLRSADPGGTYDYNHIYTGSAQPDAATRSPQAMPPDDAVPREKIRVGLVDAGVATAHPAFHESVVNVWGCGGRPVPSEHGTAVASLLVANASAELYAADVYCGLATGGAVDAIIGAAAWLSAQRVGVINVSLVGPRNALLEQSVARLIEQGHLIVAAVGNDGPTAPPLYPAAYPQVIGVTGVDGRRRVLLEAERGPQVMFAATGADMKAADVRGGMSEVRGTSFAAPIVAGLLAGSLPTPDRPGAAAAVDSLARRAIDLGAPGKDLTYGYGFVGTTPR